MFCVVPHKRLQQRVYSSTVLITSLVISGMHMDEVAPHVHAEWILVSLDGAESLHDNLPFAIALAYATILCDLPVLFTLCLGLNCNLLVGHLRQLHRAAAPCERVAPNMHAPEACMGSTHACTCTYVRILLSTGVH